MAETGRPKNIKTPEEFWGYFQSFRKDKKSEVRRVPVSHPREGMIYLEHFPPLTWEGFDNWLFEKGIIVDCQEYRSNTGGRYGEFLEVCTRIDRIIYNDKFEGASVGQYNHAIIARDLGLADKNEIKKTTIKVKPKNKE